MGLETGTYISDLVATNPVGATDDRATADDHLRLIKAVLQNTFPTANSAINISAFIKTLLDDSDAATARGTLGLISSEYNAGVSGSAKTIDFSANGVAQKVNVTANCTFTFTAPASHGWLQIKVTNSGGGIYTLTWPASVKWANGERFASTTLLASTGFVSMFYDGSNYWAQFIRSFV